MARVGIIVTDGYSVEDPDVDTPLLLPALRELGLDAEATVWHADLDWAGYDLLVLRSPWDYPRRVAEFTAWFERVQRVTRVLNEPALVHWNLDKRYLAELAERGIGVVPTSYATTTAEVAAALAPHGAGWVVVKPSVSAGAHDTALVRADSPEAAELTGRIVGRGATVMVQPEVPELSHGAEKALYLVDGELTHAVAKGALLERGGGFIGGVYQETPQLVPTTDDEVAFAGATMAAIADATGLETPLYARIDTVLSAEHGLVLLEAELFEPTFNLHLVPEVVQRFAAAVAARV
ncbi:hypothetical protein C8046_02385 [Serinibacter arcticus]|uniref:ATP-grasp domain-containing protein n=1 Tax=Serinibacter arcticus TaxID=1655435 RepID=A0A2U1ZS05_9MICO|nr:hypothetical protein [Serinibacter arcticus]PWD49723.1 hypothetical protein C8046_02385 [Serinibacter arcticus]